MSLIFNLSKSIDAASLTTTQTGSIINTSQSLHIVCQFVWTGGTGTTGNMSLEGSLDGTNFVSLGTSAVSTNSGTSAIALSNTPYPFMRAVWTPSAGTGGTVTAYFAGKKNGFE